MNETAAKENIYPVPFKKNNCIIILYLKQMGLEWNFINLVLDLIEVKIFCRNIKSKVTQPSILESPLTKDNSCLLRVCLLFAIQNIYANFVIQVAHCLR